MAVSKNVVCCVGVTYGHQFMRVWTAMQQLTSVDGAKSQPEQAIVVLIFLELGTDGFSKLNGLLGYGDTADLDGVSVDIATGARPVAITDAPGVA